MNTAAPADTKNAAEAALGLDKMQVRAAEHCKQSAQLAAANSPSAAPVTVLMQSAIALQGPHPDHVLRLQLQYQPHSYEMQSMAGWLLDARQEGASCCIVASDFFQQCVVSCCCKATKVSAVSMASSDILHARRLICATHVSSKSSCYPFIIHFVTFAPHCAITNVCMQSAFQTQSISLPCSGGLVMLRTVVPVDEQGAAERSHRAMHSELLLASGTDSAVARQPCELDSDLQERAVQVCTL